MTPRDRRHRQHGHEIPYTPLMRHNLTAQHAHPQHRAHRKRNTHLEPPQHAGDLDEKIRHLRLLRRRAPRHVQLEHVREQRLADVQRQPAQENREQDDPLEILTQRGPEPRFASAVAQERERDVAQAVEHEHDAEPHAPAVDVVLVQEPVEPADGEVVGERHEPRRADGVVRPDVAQHGDLGGEADVGGEEAAEEGREWSAADPVAHRVEEQLVAAVRVLLPAGELVVHR